MYNRLVLFVSLLGMVLTLHLWIQKERNFDQGCWGIGTTAAASAEGCRDATLERAGHLFGISTAVWGYAFYSAMAALALAQSALPSRTARRCHDLSDIVMVCAFPYAVYLVIFQAFVAKAFCPLCLLSAILVAALFTLHLLRWRRGGFVPIPDSNRVQEIGYAAIMVFGTTALLAALLLFVDQVATKGIGLSVAQTANGRPAPTVNHIIPALKNEEWITRETPVLGSASGISVVGFFDPNCPHCGGVYSTLVKLSEQYKDRVAVYILPRVLWEISIPQIEALKLAQRSGKYFDMWRLQFERQKRGGLGPKEIETLFQDLSLDSTDLTKRLANERAAILDERNKARAAGINSTPVIFIDGQPVANNDRTLERMAKLIEQAAVKHGSKQSITIDRPTGVPTGPNGSR
jgi:protein-disulfide isomerase/uncharacterized membrane protein